MAWVFFNKLEALSLSMEDVVVLSVDLLHALAIVLLG